MGSIFAGILSIWEFFANNILTQPAYMIGFIVLIGYMLEKKPWYESLAGFFESNNWLYDFDGGFHWIGYQFPTNINGFERPISSNSNSD